MPRLLLASALASALLLAPVSASAHARAAASGEVGPVFASSPPLGAPLAFAVAPNPSSRLRVEGGDLDLPVGVYGDCTRASEVGHDGAFIDACIPRPLAYFIGHNPGPFTPMADVPVGSVVDYYDAGGGEHRLQVVSAREWNRFWGPPPLTQPNVVAQFQTCLTLDAVWDRILDAVEIPNPPPPAPVVPYLAEQRTAD